MSQNKVKQYCQSNLEHWIQWRHQLHMNPETAFEEFETSAFVIEKLKSFGIKVHTGLAKTGVVGVLKKGTSEKSMALRADMDALDILEENTFDYVSQNIGKMHACGHDGHTTILLATAQCLAMDINFDGTVYFIFQPAEENVAGGKVMIEDGLFKNFPADMVFGLHNWPGIELGHLATRFGALMASNDTFKIIVQGKSTHAAMPEKGIDPIVVGADMVGQLNKIVSRNINPLDASVITVTQIHSGSTWNVIPDECIICGTVRAFEPCIRDALQHRIEKVAKSCADSYGTTATIEYKRLYCPTINTPEMTSIALTVAKQCVGEDKVCDTVPPTMAAEDFGYMINAVGGNFMWLGNGNTENLHNSKYDFDDRIISVGVRYFIGLVETVLAVNK